MPAAKPRPAAPAWNAHEVAMLRPLTSPVRVQEFLDSIPYSADHFSRCPRSVLRDRKANCYDGALLAAAAMRRLGKPALLLDMRAVRDDDHVLAIFRVGKHYGAMAKSNFVGLRFREPVFKTLRELVLSYFEVYYNTEGEKTLRAFSGVLDLKKYDRLGWMFSDEPIGLIAKDLDKIAHRPLVSAAQVRQLNRVDARSWKAGLLGVNEAGLYRPGKR